MLSIESGSILGELTRYDTFVIRIGVHSTSMTQEHKTWEANILISCTF